MFRPATKREPLLGLPATAMLAPAVFFLALFIGYPVFDTVLLSFAQFGSGGSRQFAGLQHYRAIFETEAFLLSVRNNFILLVGAIVIQVTLGVIIAAILDRGITRGGSFFKTIAFLPIVVSAVAVGVTFQMILDPTIGLMDWLVRGVGLAPPPLGWLGDPSIAIYAVLGVWCWGHTALIIVIVLAAMRQIPHELYQAAALDRATGWRAFRFITLPGIRNAVVVAGLISAITAIKAFDTVYVLTKGGPSYSTQILTGFIVENAFSLNRVGLANAAAVVLMLIAVPLGMLQLRLSRRSV